MADDEDLYNFEKKTASSLGGFRTSAGRGPTNQSHGYPNVVGVGVGTTLRTSAGRNVPGTSVGPNSGEFGARPMTSVRAAGFSSRGRPGVTAGQTFDPFNQSGGEKSGSSDYGGVGGSSGSTQEEAIKTLERKVNILIEESTILCSQDSGNYNPIAALEKAKEAGKKERALCKQREQANLGDQINLDLTYCVLFNLANAYHANKMYQEALNSYAIIVKNKLFNQSGRLRVNMGNIYFEQQKFSQAVKMYRMALDQIPNTNKEIRLKIMRNIGNAFVRMGQFQDAITSFEA
ncbi:Intraflagellar transport protein 88, partial [Nowakowskiella sp. JEL0078]